MNEFTAHDSRSNEYPVTVDKMPDDCPCCHKGIRPLFKFAFFHDNEYPRLKSSYVQAVFQCPREACWRIFIADYVQFIRDPRDSSNRKYELQTLSPYCHQKKTFPDSIQKLSPSFCAVFNQASAAEGFKLSDIAGPGYRKALEFLIKDFLIAEKPAEAEKIKNTWLQNLIQKEISDTNIKVCAERATWLGNDETHYLRIWNDRDIKDLKNLITLSANWIENHLLTQGFLKSMPPKKPA